jgi:hypothetical protein
VIQLLYYKQNISNLFRSYIITIKFSERNRTAICLSNVEVCHQTNNILRIPKKAEDTFLGCGIVRSRRYCRTIVYHPAVSSSETSLNITRLHVATSQNSVLQPFYNHDTSNLTMAREDRTQNIAVQKWNIKQHQAKK